MATLLSQQSSPGIDLLRNCDLPPPLKVFSGTDHHAVAESMNKILLNDNEYEEFFRSPVENRSDPVELLRALRLSQTRAREAEAKRAEVVREKDLLSIAFAEEAMKVFGYRLLMKLMNFEVARLRSEIHRGQWDGEPLPEEEHRMNNGGGSGFPWIIAVAFCLGMAGVGIAFGCSFRCFF